MTARNLMGFYFCLPVKAGGMQSYKLPGRLCQSIGWSLGIRPIQIANCTRQSNVSIALPTRSFSYRTAAATALFSDCTALVISLAPHTMTSAIAARPLTIIVAGPVAARSMPKGPLTFNPVLFGGASAISVSLTSGAHALLDCVHPSTPIIQFVHADLFH